MRWLQQLFYSVLFKRGMPTHTVDYIRIHRSIG